MVVPAARSSLQPLAHQHEALDDLARLGERGVYLSACGTGKTLVAQRLSERLDARVTVVLVPTLALMSQTIDSFKANTTTGFAALCVCSDEQVDTGIDTPTHVRDLPAPVTLNPAEVAAFLRGPGRRVVFCTYHSSPLLAAAQQVHDAPDIDLLICDEAHRCATVLDSAFACCLDQGRLRARRRLFMTATHRVWRTDPDGGHAAVASTDDPALFGPVLHELTFRQAIDRGLLRDFEVIVAIRERAVADGGQAAAAALLDAVDRFHLNRVLAFCNRVADARALAAALPAVSGRVDATHIEGRMGGQERAGRLALLHHADPSRTAVVTNARCLTEGIDVPTLDMTAFMQPRSSVVDIIQAAGRTMRRSAHRPVGYVFVAAVLDEHATDEDLLADRAFGQIAKVLLALRSIDETLGADLDVLRRRLDPDGTTADDGALGLPSRVHLLVPPGLDRAAVRARMISLGSLPWHSWYRLLEQYAAREGHASPPYDHVEDGHRLGAWVVKQRGLHRQGALPEQFTRILERLPGWTWDPFEERWNTGLRLTVAHGERTGDPNVPEKYVTDSGFTLGAWQAEQRKLHRRALAGKPGGLNPERARRLQQVPGWRWRLRSGGTDEQMLCALDAFHAEHGHWRPRKGHVTDDGLRLGVWLANLRRAAQGASGRTLRPDLKAQLDARDPGWATPARSRTRRAA